MKLKFTILLVFLACLASAQDEKPTIPKDKWSKAFYVSDEFCKTKGLDPGETNQFLRVWNNSDENAKFSRVVDIRYYFSSPAEAASYLSNHTKELSENGDPVKTKINIPGTENLKVFTENEAMRKMNASLGLKMKMYFFLFTVKNFVAKVFISSEKDITATDASIFAVEAAKRLNAAIK